MLIPIILSGGAGSRLWPVSREALPKPFIRLASGKSLLGMTLERAAAIPAITAFVTVTNREYFFLTRDEYAASAHPDGHTYILEPTGRNTAPAIAMAALHAISAHGKDTQLLVLPADHLIEDIAQFCAAVESASRFAATGALVTFGVTPNRPETGYGYIECASGVSEGCYQVARFVEKPSLERATEFLKSKRFLWNSGMFCFQAGAFMEALRHCAPEVHDFAIQCWKEAKCNGEQIELDPKSFSALPDISVDYAVMERHDNVVVVEASFPWNDIGSWNALAEMTSADANDNRCVGETITIDTRDCYIQSDSRMVAAVGLNHLVIVDTPDALLIADKSKTQDVKKVYSQLKLANHAAHQLHRTVNRPWGTYTVLEEGPGFKLKRIVVKPGASLSLQMHNHRSEHWVVLSGTAKVVNGEKTLVIHPNESTFIPAGHRHRLENPGKEDLAIIEVQVGEYVGEDDIVRFEDVYGRT
jgi:mannose-1-phosphate guanylyltransferase / mannose-6-phosphate isomerase